MILTFFLFHLPLLAPGSKKVPPPVPSKESKPDLKAIKDHLSKKNKNATQVHHQTPTTTTKPSDIAESRKTKEQSLADEEEATSQPQPVGTTTDNTNHQQKPKQEKPAKPPRPKPKKDPAPSPADSTPHQSTDTKQSKSNQQSPSTGPGWSKTTPKKANHDSATKEKKPVVGAASQKEKKDKVPNELVDGVITHIRNPLIALLADNCDSAFPAFRGKSIPESFFTKGTKEYNAIYQFCEEKICHDEFLCAAEAHELKAYHGNYEEFMKRLHSIWTRHIQVTPVNLDEEHTVPIQGLIDKYWDSTKNKPKKLSKVL